MTRLAIILAVLIAPLAVYRVVDFAPPHSYDLFTGGAWYSDLFSVLKAAIVVTAGLFAAMGVLWDKFAPRWDVLLIVCPLMLLTLLSAMFSPHADVVFTGAPGLSEGLLVLISYLMLMMAASDAKHWGTIVTAMAAGVVLMTVSGLAEYLGYPYLAMAPHWLTGLEMEPTRGANAHVSAMLGNSNHLGTYAAMVLPFFLMQKRWLIAVGAAILLGLSHSRGGAIGAAVGMTIGFLALRR